jgi:rhomboid protease GluP
VNQFLSPPPTPLRLPTYRPRMTYLFMGLIVVTYVVETLVGLLAGDGINGSQDPFILVQLGANFARAVTAGQYWRLFTANFLHIGLLHIGFYGPARFLVIYVLTGLSGAIMSYAFTYGLSAGASTALFGLVGTLVAFFVRNRSVFGEMGTSRLGNLAFIILINLMIGVAPGSQVDNFGHIGGFIGGAILGWLLCPFYQVELQAEWLGVLLVCVLTVVAFWAAWHYHQIAP